MQAQAATGGVTDSSWTTKDWWIGKRAGGCFSSTQANQGVGGGLRLDGLAANQSRGSLLDWPVAPRPGAAVELTIPKSTRFNTIAMTPNRMPKPLSLAKAIHARLTTSAPPETTQQTSGR